MISWSDTGIVISVRNRWKEHNIVNIFTEKHGSIHAIYNRGNPISSFSNVCLDWNGKSESTMGFWRIKDVQQNWMRSADFEIHVNVCQSVCFILNRTLPSGIPYPELFDLVQYISNDLHNLTKIEALKLYAYFEFILLKVTGFGFDLRICGICNQREPIDYISCKTGCGISGRCSSNTTDLFPNSPQSDFCCVDPVLKSSCTLKYTAVLCAGSPSIRTDSEGFERGLTDQLFRIPNIWKVWDGKDAYNTESNLNEINQSLTITDFFIKKHLISQTNHFRNEYTLT
ncbi:MAG: DNA repair protein RecO [Holosporales bacterium]|jgi:DNA repair protein RecO|nr:DNA repair protein RecO [Holosporales bacterium]